MLSVFSQYKFFPRLEMKVSRFSWMRDTSINHPQFLLYLILCTIYPISDTSLCVFKTYKGSIRSPTRSLCQKNGTDISLPGTDLPHISCPYPLHYSSFFQEYFPYKKHDRLTIPIVLFILEVLVNESNFSIFSKEQRHH